MVCFQIWVKLGDDIVIFSFTKTQAEYGPSKGIISSLLKSVKIGSRRYGHCIMKTLAWNGFDLRYPESCHVASEGSVR